MEFPIWVQIPCYIVYAIGIIWILYKIYDNGLSYVFKRRKVVNAKLISKVQEEYSELKTYMGTGNASRTPGFKPHTQLLNQAWHIDYTLILRVRPRN